MMGRILNTSLFFVGDYICFDYICLFVCQVSLVINLTRFRSTKMMYTSECALDNIYRDD